MSLSLVAAAEKTSPIEDHFADRRKAVAAKEREVSDVQAQHASLMAQDAEICSQINENRRLASAPEPQAADFADLAEWHQRARAWSEDRSKLDAALPPLERDRACILQRIAEANRRVRDLRFELAQIEFDAAKDELIAAERHVVEVQARVRRLHVALATARDS